MTLKENVRPNIRMTNMLYLSFFLFFNIISYFSSLLCFPVRIFRSYHFNSICLSNVCKPLSFFLPSILQNSDICKSYKHFQISVLLLISFFISFFFVFSASTYVSLFSFSLLFILSFFFNLSIFFFSFSLLTLQTMLLSLIFIFSADVLFDALRGRM